MSVEDFALLTHVRMFFSLNFLTESTRAKWRQQLRRSAIEWSDHQWSW